MLKLHRIHNGNILHKPTSSDEKAKLLTYCTMDYDGSWRPVQTGPLRLQAILNTYRGKPCYIIGKGPSLDRLSELTIEAGCPIIAINEAGPLCEKVFGNRHLHCVQLDSSLMDKCRINGTMITVPDTSSWYAMNSRNIITSYRELGIAEDRTFSAVVATRIAALFGCPILRLFAFDVLTTGNGDYAECVKRTDSAGAEKYRYCYKMMCKYHGNMSIENIIIGG